MAGKTIVILGGGTGGLVAANRLRRLLNREHRIILVDRSPWHSFAPSFIWVMVGQRQSARITRDLRRLNRKGIEFIASEVTGIDLTNRRVALQDQELSYDYLIVALGAQYYSDAIPGLGTAWTFFTLDGADGLREELEKFRSGRVAIVISALPYKCPGVPCEAALLLDHYFRRRGLREDVEIRMYTPEPYPLPVAPKVVGEQMMELMAGREVWYGPQMQLTAVDPQARKLTFKDGKEVPYDLLIATPLHRVPDVVRAAGLAQEGGWLPVDRETLSTEFEGVYAIGDITVIPLAHGKPLPKAGVFAHGEAEVVARNIAAEVQGSQPRWAFRGHGACFVETGYGKAAYGTGNFYAEPEPDVKLRQPGRLWHWAKIGLERMWLWRWF